MNPHTRFEIYAKPALSPVWQFVHVPTPNERAQAMRDAKRLLRVYPLVEVREATTSYELVKSFTRP